METKANGSNLSKNQRKGGRSYIASQLKAMQEGLNGRGRFKVLKGNSAAKNTIKNIENLMKNSTISYKYVKVQLDDIEKGCSPKNGNIFSSMKIKKW